MSAPDDAAQEAEAWARFVRHLGEHLAAQWPAMPERLGERYDAFIDLAVQQATQRGLGAAPAVARFVNLWFVWGPAYHDKPGFEWAQRILAAPPGREWATVHQLVLRSQAELQRLPGALVQPQVLAAADTRVIDVFGAYGRQGRMCAPEPQALPRVACDLEALELKVLDDSAPPGPHERLAPHQYRLQGDDWQRVPLPPPAAVRVDAARPCPARLSLLSPIEGQGPQTRLQLRLRPHATCSVDVHPAVHFSGPHGRWSWQGHAARAFNWPIATREQPAAPAGPGTLIAEETSPELHRLDFDTCGLRDEGDAIGPLRTLLCVWPSAQWWLELQRAPPASQALLPGPRPWARGSTRCRVERDGASQDSAPLRSQFEGGLDGEVAVALHKLAAAWEQLPGLAQPGMEALLGLLVGRAAGTWGWQLGPGGLEGPALMRLQAQLDLRACQADVQCTGLLTVHGAQGRLTLGVAGQALLQAGLLRDAPQPALADVLLPAATVRWRLPFTATLDPVVADGAALLQLGGPATGALVGEAGLRPNTHGGSGWEWFVGLRLEAVSVPLEVSDPVLGSRHCLQPLLPALSLIDWSLG